MESRGSLSLAGVLLASAALVAGCAAGDASGTAEGAEASAESESVGSRDAGATGPSTEGETKGDASTNTPADAGTTAPPDASVPVPSDDPFDPSSCTGASMTADEAAARLGPGATWKTFGAFAIAGRTRTCNTATGCPAWGSAPVVVAASTAGSSITFPTPSTGEMGLQVEGGQTYLRIWTAEAIVSNVKRWQTATCAAIGTALDCDARSDNKLWYGNGASPTGYAWQLGPKGAPQTGSSGVLTNRCFRMQRTARWNETASTYVEYDVAYLGRFE